MERNRNAIIVLGHPVKENGIPCKILKQRLDRAISIYSKSGGNKIILTSSSVHNEHEEAQAMKKYCVDTGVDPEHIILEPYSMNTYDTALYCSQLMNTHLLSSATVVTSGYHKLRTNLIFKRHFKNFKMATPAFKIQSLFCHIHRYLWEFCLYCFLISKGDKRFVLI